MFSSVTLPSVPRTRTTGRVKLQRTSLLLTQRSGERPRPAEARGRCQPPAPEEQQQQVPPCLPPCLPACLPPLPASPRATPPRCGAPRPPAARRPPASTGLREAPASTGAPGPVPPVPPPGAGRGAARAALDARLFFSLLGLGCCFLFPSFSSFFFFLSGKFPLPAEAGTRRKAPSRLTGFCPPPPPPAGGCFEPQP